MSELPPKYETLFVGQTILIPDFPVILPSIAPPAYDNVFTVPTIVPIPENLNQGRFSQRIVITNFRDVKGTGWNRDRN